MSTFSSAEERERPHFHKFPELPRELQLRIWELAVLAIAEPRSIRFSLKEPFAQCYRVVGPISRNDFSMEINPAPFANHRALLNIGAACVKSRYTMKSIIPHCFVWKYGHSRYSPVIPIAFNPSSNSVYLPSFPELFFFQRDSSIHVCPDPPRSERLSCIRTLIVGGIIESAFLHQFFLPNGMLSFPRAECGHELLIADTAAGRNVVALQLCEPSRCFQRFRGLEKLIVVCPGKFELTNVFPELATTFYRRKVMVDNDTEGSQKRINLFFRILVEEWKAIPANNRIDDETGDMEGEAAVSVPYSTWWKDPKITFRIKEDLQEAYGDV